MITIKTIAEPTVELYNGQHEVVGVITNALSLMDVRVQIAEQQLEGYYTKFNGEKIIFKKNGKFTPDIIGFFDQHFDLLCKYGQLHMK